MSVEQFVIRRSDLARIIEDASVDCAERNRERLRRVAATTDAVAVGWFYAGDGVCCPSRQACYHHVGFQRRFDDAMASRFEVDLDTRNPFVVRVEG